jgi:hypothetical protein
MNRKIIVANIGIPTQAKVTAHHLDFNRVQLLQLTYPLRVPCSAQAEGESSHTGESGSQAVLYPDAGDGHVGWY